MVSFTVAAAPGHCVSIISCGLGGTLSYSGHGPENSDVSVEISSAISVPVSGGHYSLSLSGIKIPSCGNSIYLSASPVDTFNIGGTIHGIIPIPVPAISMPVSGQTCTISRSNVPGGTYDIGINGDSSAGSVTITVRAGTAIHTDACGGYVASLDMSGMPAGIYTVKQDGTEVARAYVGVTPPATYTLHLGQGWNLVSLPISPESGSIDSIFQGQTGNIVVIWDYNGGDWKYWTTEPGYTNQFSSMSPGNGYYIYCYSPMDVQLVGSPGPGPVPMSSLSPGWNLIGLPTTSDTSVSSLYGTAAVVWKMESENWHYWTSEPGYVNQYEMMNPGLGYWVYK
jgi:hypothetical protein